jgi:exodeoxyribonuclease V alpha subunit
MNRPEHRPSAGSTTLEGILERVTYVNEENAWSVVKLDVPGKKDLVTVVGNLLGVQPGENLRLRGSWTLDRNYGEQFKADGYVTVKPATLVGIEKYLGSGLVRGIGKVMAGRLVECFGLSTLEIIEQTPERLREVDGIGKVRSGRIAKAWVEQKQIKDVMIFLQSHGVSSAFAIKIYKHYRDRSIAVVKHNPYRLAIDIVRPDLAPVLLRERREGEELLRSLLEQSGRLRESRPELLDGASVLGAHRLGVGLHEDRPHVRRDDRVRRLRHAGQ